ncbi:MAG: pyrroline-5-carboxylate reductase [Micrococcales bacterium]
MKINRIAVLGSGSMGTAILQGLLKAGFDSANVAVSTKTQNNAKRLADELGVTAYSLESHPQANQLAVAGADLVLVAVKPMYVIETLKQVSPELQQNALVISVAAGITLAAMQDAVPETIGVIRSMPNTPAIVGRAVTGISAGTRTTSQQLQIASELFETVGSVVVLPEGQIDALSTISGSGPAYVFYLIEEMTKAAVEMGFDETTAALLVEQTFLGASLLLDQSERSPRELRQQVTSPNGTTMRAVAKLEEANLANLFENAARAALARAKEIAAGLS